ncbi:Potassium-transporting ATPase A chain [Labilithrix luteola]|uniref:Potassium-transporting ATPase potassium-binding subunit n=1 Tax=Labilithrix luteola TaxID=1391654 RepID=A0A0K1QCX9_9BACT|nr:potassium-transporting ATPase subunit KdpA [Labilithrix luteola]AKV03270.1 Potassium-transporting ATPase A chain [Labilithrix luteola]
MNWQGYAQILLFFVAVLATAKPLGSYMARVFSGDRTFATRIFGPIERLIYRVLRVDAAAEMTWKTYALSVLTFNVLGVFLLYALQRLQGFLPGNPQHMAAVPPDLAWNTAVSFVTNTNWQAYGGESTMSYFVQMAGLCVQNFVSAATGIAVVIALIRGFSRKSSQTVGNFWFDLVRSTLFVLVPVSFVVAIVLVSQGVVQTFDAYVTVPLVQAAKTADGKSIVEQVLALGPAASQIAIKQLGTNGGGFFNANSAHPFENTTPLTNFVEMWAIFAIPAALCVTFGKMVKDARQGWAVLAAMTAIFVPLLVLCVHSEQAGSPALHGLPVDQLASLGSSGGNMEGKEVRFGISATSLFAAVTTGASCGAVNGMHDSFTPLGGLVPLWLIQLGEIVFGGVGSGLYGMLMFAIIAVFVGGLMVGRTPEYLGKKIEAFEMKMASLVILIPASVVLVGTAIAVVTEAGQKGVMNPGAHGFTEVLYAFSSAANNNGSAFGGLGANSVFYNVALGIAMFVGRFGVMVPVLAIAGSLAKKKLVPASSGTLPTHTPLFVTMLVGVVILVGALTFIPALALGPIVEQIISSGS